MTTPLSGKIFHRQGGTSYGQPTYQIWIIDAPVTKVIIAVQMQKIGWFGGTFLGGQGALNVTGNVTIR